MNQTAPDKNNRQPEESNIKQGLTSNPSIDDMPHKDRLLMMCILFIPCLFVRLKFDGDTYWLINSGRYVLANGFPHIEPFTFHQGLHFVMQQWLSATIFALIYIKLGSPFLFLLVAIVNGTIIYSVYSLCMRISENNFLVSYTIAFAASIPLNLFMVLRPYMFSLLLFSIELNFLESCTQTCHSNKSIINQSLLALPILSAVLINLHAALWPFFFVLLIPYFIDGLNFNIPGIKSQGYPLLPLGIATALSIAAGWLNPYGFESMTYLFQSYGNKNISNLIMEMQSPNFKDFFGILIFIIYFIPIFTHCIFNKDKNRLRYVLLFIGTAYMGLSSVRSVSLFLVCGVPFIAYPLRNVQILKKPGQSSLSPWLRNLLGGGVVIFIGFFFWMNAEKYEKKSEAALPVTAVDYVKTHLDPKQIRLYTDYNTGGYAEFQGLRPFIDARAEVFLKSNNGKEDIIEDYFKVRLGKMHYCELIKKYNLTHFLVGKENHPLYAYFPEDPNMELLFSDGDYSVFKVRSKDNFFN